MGESTCPTAGSLPGASVSDADGDYHVFKYPGTDSQCDNKSMPRFFGSDPDNPNSLTEA